MIFKKILLFVSIIAYGYASHAVAQSSALSTDRQLVVVEQGIHKLLRQSDPVSRVAVGDPSIADINVVNGRELIITGKKPGITSLIIWPRLGGAPTELRLRVGPALDPLRRKPDPAIAGAVIDANDGLSGRLPNLLAHQSARTAAKSAQTASTEAGQTTSLRDRSTIDLETQVLTEVKIVEVKRSALRQYGINLFKATGNMIAGLTGVGSSNGVAVGGTFAAGSNLPIANAFNLAIGDPSKGLLGILSILETKGLARVYAEPTLLATSGQSASFLAGGEFPVPVSQGATGGVTIQYREFGVRLQLSPTVLDRNRISIKVAPEVSELDFSAGISTGGVAVPALSIRRADTTIELGDGESFVISGLVSNNLVNNINKVPWLGDLPFIGAFFKSISTSRTEKELIMIVTPHLVRPLRKNTPALPVPGEKTDLYNPSFGQLILQETGEFDNNAFGFSR